MKQSRQIRVVHAVGGLNRGGSETWLKNVYQHIDRQRFSFDFLVYGTGPFAYEEVLRRQGAAIHSVPLNRNPYRSLRQLAHLFRRERFDVVHAHTYLFSGLALAAAAHAGVATRIVHAHTARREHRPARQMYAHVMRALLKRYATHGIAVSDAAGRAFFGRQWGRDDRWRLGFCGIDLAQYGSRSSRASTREALNIPADALVLGHVGRFVPEKNHALLVRVLCRAVDIDSRVFGLFVGDGPLLEPVRAECKAKGILDRVVFAGARDDVPHLLTAMDAFVFPSLFEGLPLSVVEAQAAGVPVIMSDRVTDEVICVPDSVTRVPIEAPTRDWVSAILRNIGRERASVTSLDDSRFDIRTSVRALENLYSGFEASSPCV
jgi:glycosyltransferase involved in cell wall biosynthesis